MDDNDLKQKQEAGQTVEIKMLEFLLQFEPARELRVCDVKMIADHARQVAFNSFWGFGR